MNIFINIKIELEKNSRICLKIIYFFLWFLISSLKKEEIMHKIYI
jgi:hypothetical protein